MSVLIAATFQGVMETIGYVLLAILCLMFMIVVHELGHFIAGKALKFKINEFSIGFGPAFIKIKSKKSDTVFTVRPIPLGGFCAFEGEDGESEHPEAFNKQAPWKRLIVLFSGAFFNFISAIVLITIFFSAYGQVLPMVGEVFEGSPAESCGLREGDVFLGVDGKQINVLLAEDFTAKISKADDTATFKILRDGKAMKITVTRADYEYTAEDEDGNVETLSKFGFGFSITNTVQKLGFFRALGRSFSFCFFVVFKILQTLGGLITGAIGLEAAGGPITAVTAITEASRSGMHLLIYAVSILSANLAIMNLLPLPALDGSRMVFTLIEWIRKKPINRKVESIIHTVGLIVLFSFTILLDILQLVN